MNIAAFIENFVPKKARSEEYQYTLAQNVVGISAAMVAAAIIFSIIYFIFGHLPGAIHIAVLGMGGVLRISNNYAFNQVDICWRIYYSIHNVGSTIWSFIDDGWGFGAQHNVVCHCAGDSHYDRWDSIWDMVERVFYSDSNWPILGRGFRICVSNAASGGYICRSIDNIPDYH